MPSILPTGTAATPTANGEEAPGNAVLVGLAGLQPGRREIRLVGGVREGLRFERDGGEFILGRAVLSSMGASEATGGIDLQARFAGRQR